MSRLAYGTPRRDDPVQGALIGGHFATRDIGREQRGCDPEHDGAHRHTGIRIRWMCDTRGVQARAQRDDNHTR